MAKKKWLKARAKRRARKHDYVVRWECRGLVCDVEGFEAVSDVAAKKRISRIIREHNKKHGWREQIRAATIARVIPFKNPPRKK